jgi:hypothetical protein
MVFSVGSGLRVVDKTVVVGARSLDLVRDVVLDAVVGDGLFTRGGGRRVHVEGWRGRRKGWKGGVEREAERRFVEGG